jgi:hypothetical protein
MRQHCPLVCKGHFRLARFHHAVNRLLEEKGGLGNIRSSGEFARNSSQADNFRKTVTDKEKKLTSSCPNPLLVVMDRCKTEQRDPQHMFIREVSSAPEMLVVLANNMQLSELK